MANYKVTDAELISIADAIRTKGGTSASLAFPSGFVSAIGDISGGIILSEADEGKVVVSGALSVQGSMNIVSNSVYDTTLFSEVSVAIPAATLVSKTISENGTYYASSDNADGFSKVVIDVAGGGGGGIDPIALNGSVGSFYDNTLSTLRNYAFISASEITGVEMTKLEKIPNQAFASCSNLEYASFAECKEVSDYAFRYCMRLSSVVMPECKSIRGYAFESCKSLIYISIPKCESIGTNCFSGCAISEFSNSLVTVLNGVFQRCSKLESVDLPACMNISNYCFSYCSSLKTVSIPNCEYISGSAFYSCNELQEISLPKCSYIGGNTFAYCEKLESVYLLSTSVCSLGYLTAFSYTPISMSSYLGYFGSIFVPSSLVDAYKVAQYWSIYSDRITAYVEE